MTIQLNFILLHLNLCLCLCLEQAEVSTSRKLWEILISLNSLLSSNGRTLCTCLSRCKVSLWETRIILFSLEQFDHIWIKIYTSKSNKYWDMRFQKLLWNFLMELSDYSLMNIWIRLITKHLLSLSKNRHRVLCLVFISISALFLMRE